MVSPAPLPAVPAGEDGEGVGARPRPGRAAGQGGQSERQTNREAQLREVSLPLNSEGLCEVRVKWVVLVTVTVHAANMTRLFW